MFLKLRPSAFEYVLTTAERFANRKRRIIEGDLCLDADADFALTAVWVADPLLAARCSVVVCGDYPADPLKCPHGRRFPRPYLFPRGSRIHVTVRLTESIGRCRPRCSVTLMGFKVG